MLTLFLVLTAQELREMAVRGTDGPGLHILDILPEDFKHVEGFEAALLNRGEVGVRFLSVTDLKLI